MLNDRIVVPAALAITQLRRFAEHSTTRLQQHLTAFQVLHGVTFLPTETVKLTQHAQHSPDACRVSLRKDERACYHALAMHTTTPPAPSISLQTCPDLQANDAIYAKILFHGKRLQLLTKISAPHQQHSSASFVIPNDVDPETATLDAALQLAIVHIQRRYKAFSLPAAIGSYRLFNPILPPQGTITVWMTARHNSHVLLDAEITHAARLIARLDAIEMIIKKGNLARAN